MIPKHSWLFILAFLVACDCGSTPGNTDGGTNSDGGGTGNDGGGTGNDGGGASTEICNGIDDDRNGKIDDLDVEGDGICDCLRIATLGDPGGAGNGNVFSNWLEGKSATGVADLSMGGDVTITPALLSDYQVIVVQDIRKFDDITDAERDAVQAWVDAGGGLMTLTGYWIPEERENVNKLLAPFDLSYGETAILTGSPTVPIDDTWATHPTSMGITAIGMDNGYPVVVSGSATTVATEQGHVIGAAAESSDGKVFVWGDEWITFDTEWDDPRYQVEQFWVNVINWLTPQKACEISVPLL